MAFSPVPLITGAVGGGQGFRWAAKSEKSTATLHLGQKSLTFYGRNMIRPPRTLQRLQPKAFFFLRPPAPPGLPTIRQNIFSSGRPRPVRRRKSLPCARGGGTSAQTGAGEGIPRCRFFQVTPLSRLRRQLPPRGALERRFSVCFAICKILRFKITSLNLRPPRRGERPFQIQLEITSHKNNSGYSVFTEYPMFYLTKKFSSALPARSSTGWTGRRRAGPGRLWGKRPGCPPGGRRADRSA